MAAVLASGCGGKQEPPRAPTAEAERPWVCEACGHAFAARPDGGAKTCPNCGVQAAVRSIRYKCLQCGKAFEAYRFLDLEASDPPAGVAGMPPGRGAYFKLKGGPWVEDEEALGGIKCPHCGNADRRRMELSAEPPAPSH